MRKKQNRQITMKPGQTIDIGPSVKIEPQEPAQTLREFAETVVSKMAESLEVPLDSIDYESPPNFSLARVIRQASLEAISMPDSAPDKPDKPYPDEIIDTDEKGRRFTPRPCVLCERLREKGVSKSYVYCVKNHNGTKTRHCKCGSCGNTWKQIDSFC